MTTLPTIKGETISAFKDKITAYETPSITNPKFSDSKSYKNDGLFWMQGQEIGEYSGEKQVVNNDIWYKVNFTIYRKFRNRLLGLGYKYAVTKINGDYKPLITWAWFRGADVAVGQINSVAADAAAAKKKKEDEEKKRLADALKLLDDTKTPKKGFFASIFGPTINEDGTVENNNIAAIVSVIVILLLSIVGLVFLKRRKTAKAQPTVTIVRKNAKNYIVNPQTNK